MTGPWDKDEQVAAALRLWRLGFNVLATPDRQKAPAGSWKRWQTERQTERFVVQQFSHGPRGFFVVLGALFRWLVLDIDSETGDVYWREIPEVAAWMDATACARTGKGYHYYGRIPEGVEQARSAKGDGWDLQADGKGVVAPPSMHASGKPYVWLEGRGPETALEVPAALLDLMGAPRGSGPGAGAKADEGPKSTLVALLSAPPAEGGRNDWLTRVAGHYAARIKERDLYEHHVRWAASTLPVALPDEEVDKTLESIWATERAKVGEVADEDREWRILVPTPESGWLVSGGDRLLTPAKDGEDTVLEQWMDADFRARGIMRSDEEIVYDVEIRGSGLVVNRMLPADVLGDGRKLSIWLANHGVKLIPPNRQVYRQGNPGARLQAYLDAQRPPTFEAVPYLGWHEGSQAFLTHDGIIRAEGPAPFEDAKPNVGRDRADYHYGFGGRRTAQEILAEVLTFHDPEVTAVFGAWWAAVFLKPQLMAALSQFPFMAIEAPSESGKSTGYFQMILELSGAKDSNMQSTRAATRDFLTAHQNGTVWSDDNDDLDHLGELIRGSTTGMTISKKGIDHTSQVKAVLRGALVVSGEALGLGSQKALLDRAVLLEVPSPKGRMSLHDPTRPQWDDIVALRARHPDLTEYAGEYVQMALEGVEAALRDVRALRPGPGRWADKIAVVRAGSRLLARMAGERGGWVPDAVDAWVDKQSDLGAQNTLTLKVLPTILRSIGRKTKPDGPDPGRNQTATPAIVRDGEVWFSPTLCADWWHLRYRAGVNFRTETADALTQQARALGLGGVKNVDRKRIRYNDNSGQTMYWRIPSELSAEVLARADTMGVQDDGDDQLTMKED